LRASLSNKPKVGGQHSWPRPHSRHFSHLSASSPQRTVSGRRASPKPRPRSEASARRDANPAVLKRSGPSVCLGGRAAASQVMTRSKRGKGALRRATAAICCPHSSVRRSDFRFDDTELRASGWVALAVTRQGSHGPGRACMNASGSSADRLALPEGSPWLSERVPWTGCGTARCSTCVPRSGLPADASLPSAGSSRASSPAAPVLSKRYDFLPPVPPHCVACAWRYLPRAPVLCAPRRTSAPPRPGVGDPVAPAGFSQRRRQDLPSSRGTPSVRWPCSVDAGRTAGTRPLRCRSVAPGR
jgi:hypothetical protein